MNRKIATFALVVSIIILCSIAIPLKTNTKASVKAEPLHSKIVISPAETELMIKLLQKVAKSEPHITKVAIAAVVINRLNEENFPKTIERVITQIDQSVSETQFSQPIVDEENAITDALNGWDPSEGAVFFEKGNITTKKHDIINPKKIGNFIFFR